MGQGGRVITKTLQHYTNPLQKGATGYLHYRYNQRASSTQIRYDKMGDKGKGNLRLGRSEKRRWEWATRGHKGGKLKARSPIQEAVRRPVKGAEIHDATARSWVWETKE